MSPGRRPLAFALALAAALAVLLLAPGSAWAGYTHYWTWKRAPDAARVKLTIAEMRTIAGARRDLVTFSERDGAFLLDGLGENAHETLVFPGTFRANEQHGGFNFVKTAWKPYDVVVTACLLVARDHFGAEEVELRSDGDDRAWDAGRALYRQALGRAPPAVSFGESADDRPPPEELLQDPSATPGSEGAPGATGSPGAPAAPLTPWRHLLLPAVAVVALAVLASRAGQGGGGSGASYYVFWIVAPTIASFVAARPVVLVLVPVALLLRRWLPDPWLWLRDLGRARALEADAQANPANVTARRDLAKLWLAQGRAARALPLLDQALARDPGSAELHHLRGLCLLRAGEPTRAVDDLVEVVHLEPRFLYGEPYLHAADALIELARWDDAEDALERFLDAQRSSVEGWYKLALVRRARGDRGGAGDALREARTSYHGSPAFHRRRHFGWFVRAWLRARLG